MKPAATQSKTFYQRWSLPLIGITLGLLPVIFTFAVKAVQSNVNRVEDWLPKSFEETRHLAWFRKNFASDQFVIVSWEGCQLADKASETVAGAPPQDDPRLAQLARLLVPAADSASTSDSAIDSPALANDGQPNSAFTVTAEDDAARRKYFKSVLTGREVLDRLTNAPLNLPHAEALKRLQGTMIGPDGQQTCLVVTLHPAALSELKLVLGNSQQRVFRDDAPAGILRRFIEQAGIAPNTVHLGGPPVDNSAIDEEGERTLLRLAGLSGLLGLGLAWWSLRSIPLTIIVFFCGVMSAATSLAIVGLSGQNIDAILMSMPSLVYVLAISGAVHLVNYFREAIEEHGLHGAAERAVQHAWKPALLCSVTTAVGLLSLAASELVPIRKFGIFSAAGVMSLVGIVYLFLPAALHLSGIGRRWLPASPLPATGRTPIASPTLAITAAPNRHRVWERLADWIVEHYRLVGIACCVSTIAVGWGIQKSSSSIDLLKLFDHRARILADYRWLEANLGKLVPLEIVVRFPKSTQREVATLATTNDLSSQPQPDWSQLSFIQRLETVTRMQSLIDRRFGPEGADLVGQSLSAASFVPKLPTAGTGNRNFIQRKALDARLSRSKQELTEAGFLRVDPSDDSELWRISLRVAAFRDVDYGQFVKELEQITQPLLAAYHARVDVLDKLSQLELQQSLAGKRVLLWSYSRPTSTEDTSQQTFDLVLHRLLEESRCHVSLLNNDPSSTPLSAIESLGKLDAVVACGDFSDADLAMLQAVIPHTVDARVDSTLSHPKLPASALGLAATTQRLNARDHGLPKQPLAVVTTAADDSQLSAVYTGVVPIVYQAQRALLKSLVESTWCYFLTNTHINKLLSLSILSGGIALIPNTIPVIWIFGGMGWLNIPIDIGSMMTASIALGVAVDDTIHFLSRYREQLGKSPDRKHAIALTYSHCAVPTLQAALISGLGLSVFAFSTFTPTQRFGWLMLCILLAGVVSELVILPALLASPLGKAFAPRHSPAAMPEESVAPAHEQRRAA